MKKEFYRCKPRLANDYTFIEVDKITETRFSVTHHFRHGGSLNEEYTKKEISDLKKAKLITKVSSIAWNEKGDTEECQTTTEQKKKKLLEKIKTKKLVEKKPVTVAKTVIKKPIRKSPQK